MNQEVLEDIIYRESKKIVRRPYATVRVTWAGIGVDNVRVHHSHTSNRASLRDQVIGGLGIEERWAFCETVDGSESTAELDNGICAMPDFDEQHPDYGDGYLVGWWGSSPQPFTGQNMSLRFPPSTITKVHLRGYLPNDSEKKEWPVGILISCYGGKNYNEPRTYSDGSAAYIAVFDNDSADIILEFKEPVTDVTSLRLDIASWSHLGGFVKMTKFAFADIVEEYRPDDILTMSILEETDGDTGSLPIGNVSCNSLELTLQNLDNKFSFGNTRSPFQSLMRANRRIEPRVGFIETDESGQPVPNQNGTPHTLLVPKGVYWSRDWTANQQENGTSTSAIDRMGLLQNIEYRGLGLLDDDSPNRPPPESKFEDGNWISFLDDILKELKEKRMKDLRWDFGMTAEEIEALPIVNIMFFPKMSYFNIIKHVATLYMLYAYMDNDVLRFKKIKDMYDSDANPKRLTKDDIITKSNISSIDNIVNIASTTYKSYTTEEKDNGIEIPKLLSEKNYEARNDSSMLDFGEVHKEINTGHMARSQDTVMDDLKVALSLFSSAKITCEVFVFGDPTLNIGNMVEIPEYQRDGIDVRGVYCINRITTEFDGSLRQAISSRSSGINPLVYKIKINLKSEVIQSAINETVNNYLIINNSTRIDFSGNIVEFNGYAGTYNYTAYIRGIPAVSGEFNVG